MSSAVYFLLPPQPKSPKTGRRASTAAETLHTVCFTALPKRSAALRAEFRHTLSGSGRPAAIIAGRAHGGLSCAAVRAEPAAVFRTAGGAYPFLSGVRCGSGSGRGGGLLGTAVCPFHHAVAVPDSVPVVPAHQNIRKLMHLPLIFAVQLGIAAIGTVAVAQLKLYLVKPR